MKKYEAVCVFNPSVKDDKIQDIISKIDKKIADLGGKIEKTDKIGTRKLAYNFKKFSKVDDGYYTVFYFESESGVPAKLNSYLRIIEELMRYSIVISKGEEPEKVEVALPGAEVEDKPSQA